MNENHIFILLSIVKNNGDIKRLIRLGLSFQAIAELTEIAINRNLLNYMDENISITKNGYELMEKLEKKFKQTDKEKWIDPENESRVSKLEKNDVFLPKQDDLWFNK